MCYNEKFWKYKTVQDRFTIVCPPAVQRSNEEEENCGERQGKDPTDHQGAGPEEEWGAQPGMAEGLLFVLYLISLETLIRFTVLN